LSKIVNPMARYALRNQKKIIEKLGQRRLDIMLISLMSYFSKMKEVEIKGTEKNYQWIEIPNIAEIGSIQFYIITVTYDVYLLAFKQFIKTE